MIYAYKYIKKKYSWDNEEEDLLVYRNINKDKLSAHKSLPMIDDLRTDQNTKITS